jgi:hypothetical protein
MAFPFDIFQRLFEGDWIAWTTLAFFIVIVGLVSFLIILWWKLPQFAKAGFINNLIAHRPVVLECFENKKVVFQIPQMFRNGLAYLKGAWFIPPKLWVSSADDLKAAERQAVNAVYSGDGCPAGLYVNYSIQSQVANPELLVIVQHERELKRLSAKDPIEIDKELFIAALRHIKDKSVQLQPMNLDLPIDIRDLKTMLPKSLSKSELAEQENRIRQDVRQDAGFGGNKSTVLVILIVISVILGVVSLLHDFKVF